MDHQCTNLKCGKAVINNKARFPNSCPACDSPMIHTFDEDERDHEPDDFEEYNRNEANDYRDE